MKKNDKINLLLAGAGVLVALYAFMPKGEQGALGSSGGLGASEGGLPGGSSGGGGADTPTVNIDFPALPPFIVPEEPPEPGVTKKEAATAAQERANQNYPPGGLEPFGPWREGTEPFGPWREPTKKESAITSVWDLRLFGKSQSEQKAIAPSLFPSSTAAGRNSYSSFLQKYALPTVTKDSGTSSLSAPTKKESGIGSGSRSYGSKFNIPGIDYTFTSKLHGSSSSGSTGSSGRSTGTYDQWGTQISPN